MEIIKEQLAADEVYVVDLIVHPGNRIELCLDKKTGVSIDYCVKISRMIDSQFDREVEDFEMEVSSAGIGQPFKVLQQYEKNLNNEVELLTNDGKKMKGQLIEVAADSFTVKVESLVKVEGKKRKELQISEHRFAYDAVKYVKDIVVF
ncbi:MAG: ribosome assembly cofactor RimP [Marinilabiliaceae bacterium]|nr:ribosome assembly cofactor RimP [Marinilabiliaceae bacterium]